MAVKEVCLQAAAENRQCDGAECRRDMLRQTVPNARTGSDNCVRRTTSDRITIGEEVE